MFINDMIGELNLTIIKYKLLKDLYNIINKIYILFIKLIFIINKL